MSDEPEIKSTPIQQAWLAARRAHDAATANALLTAHGGDARGPSSVPANRVQECIAALKRLAGKPKGDRPGNAPGAASGLERVRRDAFANIGSPAKQRAAPVRELDVADIYDRWNHPPGFSD